MINKIQRTLAATNSPPQSPQNWKLQFLQVKCMHPPRAKSYRWLHLGQAKQIITVSYFIIGEKERRYQT